MNFDDIEGQELCESDYRGIVSGAESNMLNIKRQLFTAHNLRGELAGKEQKIIQLYEKIAALERNDIISTEFYHKEIIEGSLELKKALESSRIEQASLTRQLSFQAVESDSLKREVEALVNELSDMREKSDKQAREVSVMKTQLGATEEALHEVQSKSQILRHEMREAEQATIDVRNEATVRNDHIERDLQYNQERCLLLQKNLTDSESRAEDQATLYRELRSKYDNMANRLSVKESEAEHLRKIYSEQETVVDTLTGLRNGIRAHQIQEDENNRRGMDQAINEANLLKNELQETDSAVYFVSTNAELIVSSITQPEVERKQKDLDSRNSKLKESAANFESVFSTKFSHISPELTKIVKHFCDLLNVCTTGKEVQDKLALELVKTNGSTESAAHILQKMEGKYLSMKNQVKQAKYVMQQQQSKFVELLNTISVLSAEKEKKEMLLEKEKEENRKLKIEQNLPSMESKRNEIPKSAIRNDFERTYPYGTYTPIRPQRDLKKDDEEDVKILHETLNFVESLAVKATALESRYEEVLAEKRLLKRMCAGYDQLKSDLSNLASSCHTPDTAPTVLQERVRSLSSPYSERGSTLGYERTRVAFDDLPTPHKNRSPHTPSHTEPHTDPRSPPRPTLRVVGIYVLAGLRLVRILGQVRAHTQTDDFKKHQPYSSSKKSKSPQLVFEESFTRKFGYNGSSELASRISLLDLIKSDGTQTFNSRSSSSSSSRYGLQGGEALRNLCVVRDALRGMSDVVTGLKAKELLLFLAESRYGEQQRDLLTALGEAERALRDRNTPYKPYGVPMSDSLREPPADTSRIPTAEFTSKFLRQPMSESLRLKMNESAGLPLSTEKVAQYRDLPVRDAAHSGVHSPPVEPYSAVKGGRDGDRGQGSSSSISSSVEGEGDSVLGEIQKTLNTPAAHRYPLYHTNEPDKLYTASTPSFFSSSFASPLRESPDKAYTPGGSRAYTEQVLAGDEKHVSVALRAYAMSVVEDEKKSWRSPGYLGGVSGGSRGHPKQYERSEEELRPVRMFTEDEIVNMSQSSERS